MESLNKNIARIQTICFKSLVLIWMDFFRLVKIVPSNRRFPVSCLIALGFLACFSACSGLKHVPDTEKIYTGATIQVDKSAGVGKASKVVNAANDLIRPQPNSTFLGIRFGLWWYFKTVGDSSKINKWLFKKLAEPPVYLSKTRPEQMNKALEALLFNHGYFDSYSNYEIREKAKTASIVYTFQLHSPYTIDTILFPESKDELGQALTKAKKETILKVGQRYQLDKMVEERLRIVNELKELGFYFLGETDLIFSADSTIGQRKVVIRLKVSETASEQSLQKYKIDEVNVNADFELGVEKTIQKRVIDSINYFSDVNYVRPKPIIESVFFKNGKIYNRKDHNLTYNRLMGLGIYKYVNIRLSKSDSSGKYPSLTANILLVPLPRKSVTAEVQGVSKSNNFIGPGLNFSHRNRNALGGAELMVFGLRTSFETQLNGPYKGKYTLEINPKLELYVPRFIAPFAIQTRSMFVPKTKFIFDYSYLSRVNYFDVNSFKFVYGYKWKSNLKVDHDFSLLNITYYDITNQSQAFLDLLKVNPLLNRRFEKQLIAGLSYSFFYNEQVDPEIKRPFYFNANFESAGNTISAYNNLINNKKPTDENPLQVANVRYSQYLRLDVDVRQYLFLGKKRQQTLATRLIAGWGLPYSNSSSMPYIKQFFSGGAYSLRGFPSFSVGPGTYTPPDSAKNLFFLQQGGEIKLELNVEYRFPIFSVVKGAFFADGGNTWLNRENPEAKGGKFTKSFYKELAANVGFGLRADVQFFVLRLDLGIPIRKPWLPENDRWVFNKFDFSSSSWRGSNLILNLAFGYPF